jgi:hypothetical protein
MMKLINLILVATASFVLALIFIYLLHRPSNRIVSQWQQPSSISYHSFDPYYLTIVESDIDWQQFPFNWQHRHYIYVGHDSRLPRYGHYLEFSFHPGYEDLETHLKKSDVEWSADGVTFKEASGHRLFIPKAMFIGGR